MEEEKGLLVWVYRSDKKATNGVTASADMVLLVGSGVEQVTTGVGLPRLRLTKRMIGDEEYLSAVPVETNGKWHMFGGNFVYSSDGRFPNKYPIPVHDRTE